MPAALGEPRFTEQKWGGVPLPTALRRWSARAAEIVGLSHRKGRIAEGAPHGMRAAVHSAAAVLWGIRDVSPQQRLSIAVVNVKPNASTPPAPARAGLDADVVVWDPEGRVVVGADGYTLYHKHKASDPAGARLTPTPRRSAEADATLPCALPLDQRKTPPSAPPAREQVTPYEGVKMFGRVKATFVRGQLVFADGQGVAPRACGEAVLRGPLAAGAAAAAGPGRA